ncbi:MAG TPA: hypothetical protein VMZ91_02320 [Candidatus Paceibacterota bacterium]|nr:hypothetical protein [Candidatus Paceibacterota bacterium]
MNFKEWFNNPESNNLSLSDILFGGNESEIAWNACKKEVLNIIKEKNISKEDKRFCGIYEPATKLIIKEIEKL